MGDRRVEEGLQIVYEDELHLWAICPCPQHVGGDLPPSPHGSVAHCCDCPHNEPPGLVRFGKPLASSIHATTSPAPRFDAIEFADGWQGRVVYLGTIGLCLHRHKTFDDAIACWNPGHKRE